MKFVWVCFAALWVYYLLHCFWLFSSRLSFFVWLILLITLENFFLGCPQSLACIVHPSKFIVISFSQNSRNPVSRGPPQTKFVAWGSCNSTYDYLKYKPKHTWGPISRYNFPGMVSFLFLLLYLTPENLICNFLELVGGVGLDLLALALFLYCGCSPVRVS